MIIARQSTARTVMIGPVLDADGVAVTGGVVGDLKISKNGAAPAALNGSATLTHRHTGHYSLALTATDLDTVGQAEVVMDDTVNAMQPKVLTVIEEAVYDISFAASATGAVPVASIATGAITAASIAADAITDAKVASDVTIASVTGAVGSVTGAVGSVTGSVGSVASGGITAASFAANAINAAKLDPDVTTELQAGLATAASIAALNNLSAAQVNAEVDTAIADARLDELLAADSDIDGAAPPTVGSVFHELMTKTTGSFTYDQTTDSLEAVRDNMGTPQTGDAFARLGAPAGASVSADIAAIEAQTDDIGVAGAGLTALGDTRLANLDATVSSRASQTSVDDLPTNAELATSQAAADDATLAAIAALNNLSAAQVNAEVDTALADIHLDHLLAVTYDPASKPGAADALLNELVESDAGVARYTANALEQAPTGGSAPTASEIADAVWEEAIADHSGTVGSTAEALEDAGGAGTPPTVGEIADAVWDEATAGHTTSGTFGEQVKTDVDAILADTNELQTDWVNGGRLDTILDARASQTSVDDLPTNAELATSQAAADDATLAAIAALNNLSSAQAQTAAAAALTAYDPPTRAEATADKDEVLTAVGDVPTNAELATALASADDAVLAAIAALNNLSAAAVNAEVDQAITDAALATAAALSTAQTAITGIKAKTDSLTFTQAGHVDANVQRINDVTVLGTGVSGDTWRPA